MSMDLIAGPRANAFGNVGRLPRRGLKDFAGRLACIMRIYLVPSFQRALPRNPSMSHSVDVFNLRGV